MCIHMHVARHGNQGSRRDDMNIVSKLGVRERKSRGENK